MKRRRSQRVEVACPNCAHAQWEAAVAVSTFCRGCGSHFEIARGRAVSNGRNGAHLRLASDDLWSSKAALSSAAAHARKLDERTANGSKARHSRGKFSSETGDGSEQEFRSVACFECGREEEVSTTATSTICPACKAHISLRNVHVRNDSRQKIKTRGDVTIHRNASLQGSSLFCRNLKVMGSISGSVECSGTASFYSDCEVRGVFSCKLLRVRKNVTVHFEHAVNAHDVEIAGDAFGHFYCAGNVRVDSEGILRGEIIARTIDIADDGSMEASLRICAQESPSPSPGPPPEETAGESSAAPEDQAEDQAEDEPSVWVRRKASPASA